MILASTPLLTAILGLLLLRERLHLRTWLAGGAAFAGVLGIVGGSFGHSGLIGDLAALVGSVSLAMLFITWRKFPDIKQLSAMCIAGVFTAATALPFLGDFSLNVRQAGFAMLNGLVIVPICLALMSMAPASSPRQRVSLVTLLEAVLGPFLGLVDPARVPTTQTLLCGFLILLTLVIHSYLDLRAEGVRNRQAVAAGGQP